MLFRRHKITAMVPAMLLHETHQEWWTLRLMPPRGVCSTQRVQQDVPCASMGITCWPASLLHHCRLRALLSTHPTNSGENQQVPRGAGSAGWSLPTAPLWIRADRLAMSRTHASGRTWGTTSEAISIQWYFWYSSKSFSLHKFSTELILGISPSFVVKREDKRKYFCLDIWKTRISHILLMCFPLQWQRPGALVFQICSVPFYHLNSHLFWKSKHSLHSSNKRDCV